MMLPQLPRDFSLSTILGAGLFVGTCVAWWVGKLTLADAMPVLAVAGTWVGLPQRLAVPTVATQAGEAVPVAQTGAEPRP